MKRSKFTEAQIAFVLKQAEEGTSVSEVCRKAGIAEAIFYNWRKKYGWWKSIGARGDDVSGRSQQPDIRQQS